MRAAAIISTLAVFSASALSAFPIERCDRLTFSHHAGEVDHRDIGNGHVVYEEWGSFPELGGDGHTNGSTVVLLQCQTGRVLEIRQRFITDPEADTDYDYRDAVAASLTSVVEADEVYTIDDLKIIFDEITDGGVTIDQSPHESCGCHAAYPRLRGDKTPFDLSELQQ